MFEYKIYTNKKGQKVVLCLTKYNGRTIRGKAICHPDDTFNEELGKTIAYTRAETEYLSRRLKDIYSYKQFLAQELEAMQNKCVRVDKALKEVGTKYATLVEQGVKLEAEIYKEKEY